MTRWLDPSSGGRRRGPRGLLRAWIAVLYRPRTFFRESVVPGDQAPGLLFAMAVVLIEEATRLALVPGAIPAVAGGRFASAAVALGVAVLLVTPAALHLAAAAATLALIPLVEDRAGIGETVQVLGYAAAPCALAGPAIPELRVACAAYGTLLLVVGIEEVHGTGRDRAALAAAVPATAVFGYGFRGFDAVATLLSRWYII